MSMSYQDMIDVITAHKDGRGIQFRDVRVRDGWEDCINNTPVWSFSLNEYRIKPEPKTIWVNEYKEGYAFVYPSKEHAMVQSANTELVRIAVEYQEVIK